ncbi:MAG: imm68 putative immunity domain-containing protein [Muribaculum sp.]|nr:imm68 putative immunity domain-containing protein [Muribaculum sp.]
MYIEKYWYNYIGGTDDSLTLVDYLYEKGKTELSLNEIFLDTGLDKLNWSFRTSPDLEYTDSEGGCHEFYYAIDLITDLAALILESKKSGGFNLRDLFDEESRDLFVKITTTPEEDQAMNRALADFFATPLEYDLHEMVGDDDMQEMARDCENLRKELYE